jgi:hypothetical protein
MPTYSITSPDGKTYSIDGPAGATQEQVIAQIQAMQQSAPAPQQQPTQQSQPPLPEESLPRAAGNFVKGIYGGLHRIPQSAAELVARGTDAVGLSDGADPMLHEMFKKDNASFQGGSKYAKGGDVVGQIAGTLPVAALRLPGLAGRAGFMAGAGRVAEGAGQGAAAAGLTSSASDAPLGEQLGLGAALGGALPLAGAAVNSIKSVVPNALSVSTGAGANSIRQAFQAGRDGGDASKQAKTALTQMKADRGAAYRSGMADVSKDKSVLDFAEIDSALAKGSSIKNYKGVNISPKTGTVRQEIDDAIAQWKSLDPAEYHTPEGMDALKQMLGEIRDSVPYTDGPSRAVADNAYNAVRGAIDKQAPGYAKVMADYAKASSLVDDLQRELSLGPKGNPNTALRKLQSVMRDNVNTSWGKRADYAATLSEKGAPNLIPSLAGQALSAPLPRGLARYGDAGLAAAAMATNPAGLAALPLASPRVVGELAHGAGAITRGATGMFGSSMPLPSLRFVNPLLGGSAGGSLAYQ